MHTSDGQPDVGSPNTIVRTIVKIISTNARKQNSSPSTETNASGAVENARENARRAGVTDAEFICGDAGRAATILAARGLRPDVVVLDPPRKGCGNVTLQAVVQMAPGRIVMVSCNPATMARDAAALRDMGYILQCCRPVDLFPRTAHCETVGLFIRE